MNNVIEILIAKYNPQNNSERECAIKEIIQEIALAGLYRGGFFDKACILWRNLFKNFLWLG